MSKSSEDTFCSEQKLVFGDYSRRWACRATIARSTIPIRVGARRLVSSRPCPAQEQHRRVHLHHAARRSQRIVCARLPLDKKKGSVLLVACKNIWFAAVPAHAASAPALAGQQIDEVTVTYTPRDAIPKQRRATHRWPMHLQDAEEGTVCRGTCGLYGDGEHLIAAPRARLAPACLPHAQVPLTYHSHDPCLPSDV